MINVPTNLLRALVMVIDLKGFTKASEELGRAQPTISLQIKKLQEMIGIALLERESGVAQLTEAGEVCAAYARRILALHDEMMNRLVAHGAGNRLRVGLPNDYADHFLPKFLGLVDSEGLHIRFDEGFRMPTCPAPSTRTWSASEIRSWRNPRSASYGLWVFKILVPRPMWHHGFGSAPKDCHGLQREQATSSCA